MIYTKEAREFLTELNEEFEAVKRESNPLLRKQKMDDVKAKINAFMSSQK